LSDALEEVWDGLWNTLYSDYKDTEKYYNVKPLLAHYTSVQNLESILKSDEVWLSNPLFMNDLEEVRFGVNHGSEVVQTSESLRDALGNDIRRNIFYYFFNKNLDEYGEEKVLDLYVMCLSEHDPDNVDGRLSMWRGYGSNGNGVALVFDTGSITPVIPNPLALAKVQYGTVEQRRGWLVGKVNELAEFLKSNLVPDDYLHIVAEHLFHRITLFAVFAKHRGFEEEREWRLVYLQDRDPDNKLKKMFGYHNGPRGIEPKLKLKIAPFEGVMGDDVSLVKMIHSILLGPTMVFPASGYVHPQDAGKHR
jgi:hypothetical protein